MRYALWACVVVFIVSIAGIHHEIDWMWYLIGLLIGHIGQVVLGGKE